MTSPDRSLAVARLVTRAVAVLAVIGLAVFVLGVLQNSDLFLSGALVLTFALVAIVTIPVGFALGAGLRRPAALADPLRVGALLVGVAGGALGIAVARAHSGPSLPVGVLLMVTGPLAASVAFRARRTARWQPAQGTIVAGILLLLLTLLLPKFQGTKPRAYYLAMQRATAEIAQWQEAVHADSGHFSAQLDTSQLYEAASFLRASGTLTWSSSGAGYRAAATSAGAPGRCAAYAGGVPEPPATRPGVAACTPYPETETAFLGTLWLAGTTLMALIGFVALRPVPDATPRS